MTNEQCKECGEYKFAGKCDCYDPDFPHEPISSTLGSVYPECSGCNKLLKDCECDD